MGTIDVAAIAAESGATTDQVETILAYHELSGEARQDAMKQAFRTVLAKRQAALAATLAGANARLSEIEDEVKSIFVQVSLDVRDIDQLIDQYGDADDDAVEWIGEEYWGWTDPGAVYVQILANDLRGGEVIEAFGVALVQSRRLSSFLFEVEQRLEISMEVSRLARLN